MGRYDAAGLDYGSELSKDRVAALGRRFVFPEIKCYSRKIAGPVAQLDRAPAYEAGGWEFDPPRGRHSKFGRSASRLRTSLLSE